MFLIRTRTPSSVYAKEHGDFVSLHCTDLLVLTLCTFFFAVSSHLCTPRLWWSLLCPICLSIATVSSDSLTTPPYFLFSSLGTMAKRKNQSARNENAKAHRTGIKKPRAERYTSLKGYVT